MLNIDLRAQIGVLQEVLLVGRKDTFRFLQSSSNSSLSLNPLKDLLAINPKSAFRFENTAFPTLQIKSLQPSMNYAVSKILHPIAQRAANPPAESQEMTHQSKEIKTILNKYLTQDL